MSDTPISISPEPPLLEPAPAPKPRRLLLKWSLVATAVLFVFLMWQCGSGLVQGGRTSDVAVADFHRNLNAGRFEQLYSQADPAFQQSGSKGEMLKFFAAIHNKLGNAGDASRSTININATTNGTFLRVSYSTKYDKGTAEETFTWRKGVTGDLTLVGYHIQSNALIVQ